MKLELKAIKHSEFASQETHCFQAKLYVNGKAFAHISNDGWGGSDMVRRLNQTMTPAAFDTALKKIDQYIAANFPAAFIMDGVEVKQDLGGWACERVNDFLVTRQLKGALRRKVLFIKDGQKGVFEISKTIKGRKHSDDQVIAYVKTRNPKCKILNTMPAAEALAAYRAA